MEGGLGHVDWQGVIIGNLTDLPKVRDLFWRFLCDLGNVTLASSLPGGPSGNCWGGHLFTCPESKIIWTLYTTTILMYLDIHSGSTPHPPRE
jgi:hypothetical protein